MTAQLDPDEQHYADYLRATLRTMDDPDTMTDEQIYAAVPWVGAYTAPHLDASRRYQYMRLRNELLELVARGY